VTTLAWQFAGLLAGVVALFVALTAAVTLLSRRVGEARVRRWMGGGTLAAPVKGLLVGVVTPFCAWSTIPVLLSLLRAGVRTSAVAAFFLASPVLDPVLVVALAVLLGVPVAVWFTVVLTVTILLAAVAAERLRLDRWVLDRVRAPAAPVAAGAVGDPGDASAGGDACGRGAACDSGAVGGARGGEPPWAGWRAEARVALGVAWAELRPLWVPLVVTSVLGVLLVGAAPEDLIARWAGPDSPLAVPAAAVLGVPLYLPSEALVPLGWGLRDAGVGAGAIFALMVTAASLNLPEIVLLGRIFRARLVVFLVLLITTVAVAGAAVVPWLVTV
jgi:uncharacterized protein